MEPHKLGSSSNQRGISVFVQFLLLLVANKVLRLSDPVKESRVWSPGRLQRSKVLGIMSRQRLKSFAVVNCAVGVGVETQPKINEALSTEPGLDIADVGARLLDNAMEPLVVLLRPLADELCPLQNVTKEFVFCNSRSVYEGHEDGGGN